MSGLFVSVPVDPSREPTGEDIQQIIGRDRGDPKRGDNIVWRQTTAGGEKQVLAKNDTGFYASRDDGTTLVTRVMVGDPGAGATDPNGTVAGGVLAGTYPNPSFASSVTFPGNVAITGTLTVGGLTSLNNGVVVANGLTVSSGGALITGNSSVTGTLAVSNTLTVSAGGITVTGNSGITGTFGVTGLATLAGGAAVSGGLTVSTGGVVVSAGGAAITGNSAVTGTLTVSSTLTAQNGLTVSAGGVTATGNSTVTGTLTVSSTLTASAALVANGLATLNGGASISSGLTVLTGGLTVSASGAAITGNSTVTGTLGVSSTLTVSAGGAAITGATTVTGALTVTTDLTVDTNTLVADGTNDRVRINDTGWVSSEKLRVGGSINCDGLTISTGSTAVKALTATTIVASGGVNFQSNFAHTGTLLGVFGTGAIAKQTVTGSRGGNAALASLLTRLASYGLVTDSSTA